MQNGCWDGSNKALPVPFVSRQAGEAVGWTDGVAWDG